MRKSALHCPSFRGGTLLHQEWIDAEADGVMAAAESVVRSVRSLRVAYGLQPKQR